jgi:hypothetical protein
LRRKGLLPRLKNDRSICLLGWLFCLELCRCCLGYNKNVEISKSSISSRVWRSWESPLQPAPQPVYGELTLENGAVHG